MKSAPDPGDTGPVTLEARNYPSSNSDDSIVVDENGELLTRNGEQQSQNVKPS